MITTKIRSSCFDYSVKVFTIRELDYNVNLE